MLRPTRVHPQSGIYRPNLLFITDRVQNLLDKRSQACPTQRTYYPVCNPVLYFSDLEKNGTDTTRLRILQTKYENPPENLIIPKVPHAIPMYADYIPVRLDVKKGKVQVKIFPEMAILQEKYYSKGIKPKLEERIKALKTFGYSDEVLMDVIQKDEKRIKDIPILEKFINEIFGEFSDKRPTPAKKKNLYQVLKIKKPYVVMPDAPDIEENVVSDNELEEPDV